MILRDRRETNKTLKKEFPIEKELPYGDFWILVNGQEVSVERKTISDFQNSHYRAGKLNRQIQTSILLIEYCYLPKKFDWQRFYQTVNGVSCHNTVLFSRHALHTCTVLRQIEQKMREGTLGKMRLPIITNQANSNDPRLSLLIQLPNISDTYAEALLQHFGSLEAIFANLDRLGEVRGIGPKRIAAIKAVWKDARPLEG